MNLAGGKTIGAYMRPKTLICLAFIVPFLIACGSTNEAFADPLAEIERTTSAPNAGPSISSSTPSATPPDVSNATSPEGSTPAPLIFVDQFGYREFDPKVAVIADPQTGFNADQSFTPGALIEVRNATNDSVVHEGAPEIWSDGATHEQSGDRGWSFDFSPVTEPGSYYLIDVASGARTGTFDIDNDVYDDVLNASLKAFWFNRGNTEHTEAFGGPWNDRAAYIGSGQDTEARAVDDKENPDTARDLSGGWFDAGDTNKYVTFASEPVHLLLGAYQANPNVFTDEVGIPESGNGIPDVLDEVRWEIEWLEKMQEDDGGVLTKVGVIDWDARTVPSENAGLRYYEEVCSSAAISAAGMFAHAALVFAEIPELDEDARRIRVRAEAAWDWYQANPKRDDCDTGEVKAGDADMSVAEQASSEVVAAVYLGALTGRERYDKVIIDRYDSTSPYLHDGFNTYSPHHGDALLFYASLPSSDTRTSQAIENRIVELRTTSPLYGRNTDADLYRSYMPDSTYHWGSNRVKANVGYSNLALNNVPNGLERALGHLHYFHGVNPVGLVYLSNMETFGAETSVQRLLHYWFGRGTIYDVDLGSPIGPAPGYVVGGPNQSYSGQATPPTDQPAQKSYRDWHDSQEPVWEITEPAMAYQASYIRLLSEILGETAS